MAKPTLAKLSQAAAEADDPCFATAAIPRPGGVDPLGLRQLNFDLMDTVFPGLNNVARHLRPFVLVTWAWRRALQLAQQGSKKEIERDKLHDFVDRIDVIYAWSQFLRDPNAPLPGRNVLAGLLQADEFRFGGEKWKEQREARRLSTALSAPIQYGPSLKMLGWIHPHPEYPGVMIPGPDTTPALDAFEARIKGALDHDAFSKFGTVVVTRKEAERLGKRWSLDDITDDEAAVMQELLLGIDGHMSRRAGAGLIVAAARRVKSSEEDDLRPPMEGVPSKFIPPAELTEVRDAWRRVQVRQVFRLALEAMLHWTIMKLADRPLSSEALIAAFTIEVPSIGKAKSAGVWLTAIRPNTGPTALIDQLVEALDEEDSAAIAIAIAEGLAFSLAEDPGRDTKDQRADRLPLWRARREVDALGKGPASAFVRHVLESWVLAQHAYWSVGRGLADARAGGKTLLRLRVILDEGGWTLTPVQPPNPPAPTADRLRTMLSLMTECGLLPPSSA
jgi:hypothetical protein